jgi:hypothetical protein
MPRWWPSRRAWTASADLGTIPSRGRQANHRPSAAANRRRRCPFHGHLGQVRLHRRLPRRQQSRRDSPTEVVATTSRKFRTNRSLGSEGPTPWAIRTHTTAGPHPSRPRPLPARSRLSPPEPSGIWHACGTRGQQQRSDTTKPQLNAPSTREGTSTDNAEVHAPTGPLRGPLSAARGVWPLAPRATPCWSPRSAFGRSEIASPRGNRRTPNICAVWFRGWLMTPEYSVNKLSAVSVSLEASGVAVTAR